MKTSERSQDSSADRSAEFVTIKGGEQRADTTVSHGERLSVARGLKGAELTTREEAMVKALDETDFSGQDQVFILQYAFGHRSSNEISSEALAFADTFPEPDAPPEE